MSDLPTTATQAQVAGLVGVARAAVTQWRKRHADFPTPVGGIGDRFLLDDVIHWLDTRSIPAGSRAPDEAAGVTYGDRARRRLILAEGPRTDRVLRSLRALGPDICGDASPSDYLYLLLCLGFLRLHDHVRWTQLIRHVPPTGAPGDARALLRRVVATVDTSLGYPDMLSGLDAPPARLRPVAYEPVRKVIELAAGLLPADFGRLHGAILREIRVRGGAIHTPPSVARAMVALLAGHTAEGNITVYDPYARFGELLAEFVRQHADPAAIQVHAEHPHPAELRLAGMRLAAIGAPADLAVTSSPPQSGATFLLTNPPFGNQSEPAWLRRCVASLGKGGRATVLMPYSAGFAADTRSHDVRRELVEEGAVLAVVALPPQMFPGTSIGVCIWLLRQPTKRAMPVQLVDARHLGKPPGTQSLGIHVLDSADIATIASAVAKSEHRAGFSVMADPDEIRSHGYSLHPPEYQDRTHARTSADAARTELDKLFADLDPLSYATGSDDGWPRRRLRELCDIRTGVPHSSLKAAMSRARTAHNGVPVVHPRHLRNGLIDADDAPAADAASLEQYRLQTGDVLCVRTGAMGQTARIRSGECGWLPHTNVLRLRVTEEDGLYPAYLLAYLSQPAVQARIQDRSRRSLTTSLSTATLGDLEMPVPPLAEQRRILAALQALDEQTATIEQRLSAARAARTTLGRHLTEGTVVLTERESQ